MNEGRRTYVEQVLDGHARIDQFDAYVEAWLGSERKRPLHEALGLGADELELIASTPDALRYVLHARRFERTIAPDSLRGQARIHDHAMRIASTVVDPFELAEIDAWLPDPEPSRA